MNATLLLLLLLLLKFQIKSKTTENNIDEKILEQIGIILERNKKQEQEQEISKKILVKIATLPTPHEEKGKVTETQEEKNIELKEEMTVEEVGKWLISKGFSDFVQIFTDNEIDGSVVLKLTDSELKEIGVKALGKRKKIISAIEEEKSFIGKKSKSEPAPPATVLQPQIIGSGKSLKLEVGMKIGPGGRYELIQEITLMQNCRHQLWKAHKKGATDIVVIKLFTNKIERDDEKNRLTDAGDWAIRIIEVFDVGNFFSFSMECGIPLDVILLNTKTAWDVKRMLLIKAGNAVINAIHNHGFVCHSFIILFSFLF